MAVVRDDSQQTTTNIMVVGENGEQRSAASVTCHIRPSKMMSIIVDVYDEEAVAANRDDVVAAVSEYIGGEVAKAYALGVPIALP